MECSIIDFASKKNLPSSSIARNDRELDLGFPSRRIVSSARNIEHFRASERGEVRGVKPGSPPVSRGQIVASVGSVAMVVFGVFVGLIALVLIHDRSSSSATANSAASFYIVKQKDTIWSISSYYSRGADPGILEYRIVTELGTSLIYPGERIRIP